jgi:hypothetical protein
MLGPPVTVFYFLPLALSLSLPYRCVRAAHYTLRRPVHDPATALRTTRTFLRTALPPHSTRPTSPSAPTQPSAWPALPVFGSRAVAILRALRWPAVGPRCRFSTPACRAHGPCERSRWKEGVNSLIKISTKYAKQVYQYNK